MLVWSIKIYSEYEERLDDANISSGLKIAIKNCPKLYDEESKRMSFMILREDGVLTGGLYLFEQKKQLKVHLAILEKEFLSRDLTQQFVLNLIKALQLYFYDVKTFELTLENKFNLQEIFYDAYRKEMPNTYYLPNPYYEILPPFVEEIKRVEQTLLSWGVSWREQFMDYELHPFFDRYYADAFLHNTISYNEAFYKAKEMVWDNILSKKNRRLLRFDRNGTICYEKLGSVLDTVQYSLNSPAFMVERNTLHGSILSLQNEEDVVKSKVNAMQKEYHKEKKMTHLRYTSPVIQQFSVQLAAWYDAKKTITKLYVDLRNHKLANNHIKEIYEFRFDLARLFARLNYVSRKGDHHSDFFWYMMYDDALYQALFEGRATIEDLPKILDYLSRLLQYYAKKHNLQDVSYDFQDFFYKLQQFDSRMQEYLEQLQSERLLPSFSRTLHKVDREND